MMEDLSLHILDIAENSIKAGAGSLCILLRVDREADLLTIEVEDDGPGIPDAMRHAVFDPFVTTRTTRRVGLGLPFLRQACRQCEGDADVGPASGRGTRVTATFRLSHTDLQPLGDLGATVVALLAATGAPHLTLTVASGRRRYVFSSADLEAELGSGCFTDPAVQQFVARTVRDETQEIAGLK